MKGVLKKYWYPNFMREQNSDFFKIFPPKNVFFLGGGRINKIKNWGRLGFCVRRHTGVADTCHAPVLCSLRFLLKNAGLFEGIAVTNPKRPTF